MTSEFATASRLASWTHRLPTLTIPEVDALASGIEGMVSFAGAAPHPSDLPLTTIEAAVPGALRSGGLNYGPSFGNEQLRHTIAAQWPGAGGISPQEVLVTSGALQGLDLLFRAVIEPGDVVVVEEASYSDALFSLRGLGAEFAVLPQDDQGTVAAALAKLVRRLPRPPKLVYVVPTFQNPTGLTMSGERRQQLVDAVAGTTTLLVEDDPYAALRFRGSPLPSLRDLDPTVVAVRSFSKVIAPGLRLGFVLGDPELVTALARLRAGVDVCSSPLAQEVVRHVLCHGGLDEHIAALSGRLAARCRAMLTALETYFGGIASWTTPEGGVFIWLTLDDVDTLGLLGRALPSGVAFVPGSLFSADGSLRNALRLSFGGITEAEIETGIRRLRGAYDATVSNPEGG